MKFDEHATVEKLWFNLTVAMIKKHGALKTAGILAGILARRTNGDVDLKYELRKRIEEA
jgi:hypothetical protein